jgi:hypothetical protein
LVTTMALMKDMDSIGDEGVRINWRAAVLPNDGKAAIYGRLYRLSKSKAEVLMDRNLMPGYRCNLVLMLPKSDPDEAHQFIEGRSVVSAAVLSSMQFRITLDWLEMKGNGETLLQERLSMHRQMWVERC